MRTIRLIILWLLLIVSVFMVFVVRGQEVEKPPPEVVHKVETPATLVLEKSFEISPTTVYGVLVMLLVSYAFWITRQNYKIQKDFLSSMSLLNSVVQQNTLAIQQFNTLIQVNDEKVLNGMRNILEEHRKETQILISNLSKDFMNIVLQKIQVPPSGAKDI